MEFFKKCVGPIVASVLLIMVTVVAAALFNGWYVTYQSGVGSSVEVDSNRALNSVGFVDSLVGSDLYLKNPYPTKKLAISSINIDGVDCSISGLYSGQFAKVNLKTCLKNTTKAAPIITIQTPQGVYSKTIYVESAQFLGILGSDGQIVQTCDLAGVSIPYGQNYVFYNASVVPFNSNCVSITRNCLSNGTLDGNASFNIKSCFTTGQDTLPDSLSFISQLSVPLLSTVISNTLIPTGYTGSIPVSVSGSSGSLLSVNNGPFVLSSSISSGDNLTLKMTSPGIASTLTNITYTIGSFTGGGWEVTTGPQDNAPNTLSLTNLTGVALSSLVNSSLISPTGFTGILNISVSGDGNPQISVNGGVFTNSTTILPGQSFIVRSLSSVSSLATTSVNVNIGALSEVWTITTITQDTIPNAFSFINQTGVPLNSFVTSNTIIPTGFTGILNISVSGEGSPTFSINGGTFGTSGNITFNSNLTIRTTSSTFYLTPSLINISVGNSSSLWTIRTMPIQGGLFSGGGGSIVNPFLISSCQQLQNINQIVSSSFELGSDIDCLNSTNWNLGLGFEPIVGFNGNLNGSGFKIINLTINRPADSNVGLFGTTTSGAVIENFTLENANITGYSSIGALVGYSSSSLSISNFNLVNSSIFGYSSTTGGLVGYSSSSLSISNSSLIGSSIIGKSSLGGLVGTSYYSLSISNSSLIGSSIAGTSTLGGLVGTSTYSSSISNSSLIGSSIVGTSYLGGLVGTSSSYYSSQSISNSNLIDSSITGTSYLGGLVGSSSYSPSLSISNSDLIGSSITGTSYLGGLVGSSSYSPSLSISNSDLIGSSITGTSYLGGLVGSSSYSPNLSISKSYAVGKVIYNGDIATTSSYTGGLLGYSNSDQNSVVNSYSDVNFTNFNNPIGVGLSPSGTINNSYSTGSSFPITLGGGLVAKSFATNNLVPSNIKESTFSSNESYFYTQSNIPTVFWDPYIWYFSGNSLPILKTQIETTYVNFSFANQSGVALSSNIFSNSLSFTDLVGSVPISVSGDGNPLLSVNGGQFTSSGVVVFGDIIQIKMTSASNFSNTSLVNITLGGYTTTWKVITTEPNTNLNNFSFTNLTNVAVSTNTYSENITLSGGFNAPLLVSVSGGFVSINGGPLVTSGTVVSGDVLGVVLPSSPNYLTSSSLTLGVGGYITSFGVTTEDNLPTSFSFTNLTNVVVSTNISSTNITLGGFVGNFPVSVSGGFVSINGGPLVTSGTVVSGDVLSVVLPSSPNYLTSSSLTMSVGGYITSFGVTTEDNLPTSFSFTNLTNVVVSTNISSTNITLGGFVGNFPVSVSGGFVSINGGPLVTSGTVVSGDVLSVVLPSSPNYLTSSSLTMSVGGYITSFGVTTEDNLPTSFSFTNLTNVVVSTNISSTNITLGGFVGNFPVSVSGGFVSINGGPLVTSGTVVSGDVLGVVLPSSPNYLTSSSLTLGVGGYNTSFGVTTSENLPTAFNFVNLNSVNLSSLVVSENISLSGIQSPLSITISGSGNPKVSINGGPLVTSGSVSNGDTISIQMTSSDIPSTLSQIGISVGGYNTIWRVTTSSFASGIGSTVSPFVIESCIYLQSIRSFANLGNSFVLNSDIDCSNSTNWNLGLGFEPILNFNGKFNGNGFKIINLTINRAADNNVGLFGTTTSGAVIENLTLENSEIIGYSNVGALIGSGSSININNVNIGGNITAYSTNAGGLVGYLATSAITDSSTNVSIVPYNSNVGGFIGNVLESNIQHSHSLGQITGYTNNQGGFIGQLDSKGNLCFVNLVGNMVNTSYSQVNITSGNSGIGGFVGSMKSVYTWPCGSGVTYYGYNEILNSYSLGTIIGNSNVGGLVGITYVEANAVINPWVVSVKNSYSATNVIGNTNVGSFIGYSNIINQKFFTTKNLSLFGAVGFFHSDLESAQNTTESYFYTQNNIPTVFWDPYIWNFTGTSLPTLK